MFSLLSAPRKALRKDGRQLTLTTLPLIKKSAILVPVALRRDSALSFSKLRKIPRQIPGGDSQVASPRDLSKDMARQRGCNIGVPSHE